MPVYDFTKTTPLTTIPGFIRNPRRKNWGGGSVVEPTPVAWGTSSTASALNASTTGVTVTKPSGVATGDVLYAFITKSLYDSSSPGNLPFTCSGWTDLLPSPAPIAMGTQTESDRHVTILRKVITDGGGEPSSYTFVTTDSAVSGKTGIIVRVTGANTTTPEDVVPTVASRTFAVNSSQPASQDMTTVTNGCLILQFCMLALATVAPRTWVVPSGYTNGATVTETTSTSTDQQCGVAYKTQTTAGAVGANAWGHTTNDTSVDNVVAVIAVRPA